MKIHKITIQGFKSFTKEQILDLNKIEAGLSFISGENRAEPSLGANGTGKSSIWEALTFAFFGKTSTNIKAGDIKNWQTEDKCKVSVEFTQQDVPYTLLRTWNPNSLKLNTETVSQDRLDEILGMNFASFIYSIFISQQADKFVDLSPVEKMDLFSTVLDLDKWSTFSDVAKEKKNILEKAGNELEKERIALEGEVTGLDVGDLDALIEENEKARESNILNEKGELTNLEIRYIKTVDALVKAQDNVKENDRLYNEEMNIVSDCINQTNDSQNLQMLIKKDLYKIEVQLELGEEEQRKIKNTFLEPICSHCFQSVKPEVLNKQLAIVERSLSQLQQQYKEKYDLFDIAETDHAKYTSELQIEKKVLEALAVKVSNGQHEVTALEKDAANLLGWIADSKERLQTLQSTANPFTAMKQMKQDKLEELKKKVNLIAQQQFVNVQKSCIYDYWIKGFKETKLMLLSEAVKEFEIEINNKLQELGMGEWAVKTEVDTETKAGTIKRGFNILIQSPLNTNLVPFSCWSGGEGQRLRLAITLGLIDFIKNKRGVTWDILIFDEPTQFLSEEGISDLIETLKDKAVNDGIKVFLIDHRNLRSFGDFTSEIKVVKNREGSRICL